MSAKPAPFQPVIKILKPYLRWVILGGTLFFLAKALKDHWHEVTSIQITEQGWLLLAIALLVTILAHVWTGLVWSWLLQLFDQPQVKVGWSIRVYLKTNIAKYLPGNVWHFYGRVWAAKAAGIPLTVAILSVVLEPLLMATAALLIALVSNQPSNLTLQIFSLGLILTLVHPRILNLAVHYLGKAKAKLANSASVDTASVQIRHYPLVPLLGELGFVGLRGAGFVIAFAALNPLHLEQIPPVFSAFSFSWLLGLIVPGAPGGLGVFEATMLALLNPSFPVALVLGVVALYRLISILAESLGAGIAWLYDFQIRSKT
jgi:hypothetical protein